MGADRILDVVSAASTQAFRGRGRTAIPLEHIPGSRAIVPNVQIILPELVPNDLIAFRDYENARVLRAGQRAACARIVRDIDTG